MAIELFERYLDHPNRDEIIAKEMGWDRDENECEPFEEDFFEDTDDDDGEEWKAKTGIVEEGDYGPNNFRKSKLYKMAFEFAIKATKFIRALPGSIDAQEVVSNFALNIATCKRALNFANNAIADLREIKEKKIISDDEYFLFINDAFEIRNAVALHILNLRVIHPNCKSFHFIVYF
ncbi:MAG: hypothetical protein QME25_02620 [Bacteroidota bacterium]|nr:hypothetical protein [Bacteroidota bacterium]